MSRDARGARSSFVQTLSREPGGFWPEGLIHHGVRLLLLLTVAVILTALFPPVQRMESVGTYQRNTVADETILAEIAFSVPKREAELERDRRQAAEGVPPTLDYRPEAVDSMVARLTRFFQAVDRAAERGGTSAVRSVLVDAGIDANPSQLALLADSASRAVLRRTAVQAAEQILPDGVTDGSEAGATRTEQVAVRREGQVEGYVDRDQILSAGEFYDQALELLPADASPDLSELLRLTLIRFVDFTYTLNAEATEEDREQARRAVPTTKATILEGEAIVRANQQIGEPEVERLVAYETQLRNRGMLEASGPDWGPLTGMTLVNLIVLGIFGLLVYFFRPEVYRNFRWMMLLALLVLAYFLAGAAIAANNLPSELLPVAFVALAVAVLWDGRMALVLAILLAVLTGLQAPFAAGDARLVTLVGGAAAALSVRAVRRRAQTWIFIAIITGAYAAALCSLALLGSRGAPELLLSVVWAGGNATVSAILAMGFLPVFEWVTGITTDQTLLEWVDPNRPLMKRLSLEAPGTYAHTINVANLAEAAANAIGANGLLCRVGVYYHDIGKVLKPQYFIENQPGGRNPHDKLKPDTSASIVREHVVEGLRLAREGNVPEVVAAFIPEHHGTQRISFFYQKALEESAEGEEPDSPQFSYPGPRPQSRETAIAMLADSVESATRALQDPSPARISDLIQNIVEGKIQEGQLDDAPLTLGEIATIKEQFVKILSGMYHHRIDYPTTKHLTDAPTGEAGGAPETVAPPGETPGDTDGAGAPAAAGGLRRDGVAGGPPPASDAGAAPGSRDATEPSSGDASEPGPAPEPAPSGRGRNGPEGGGPSRGG